MSTFGGSTGPFGAPDFLRDGLCAQTDPELFFPDKGGSTKAAKQVCAGCEVRTACLEYALATRQRFGIWGGTSERERNRILAARRRRAA